MYCPEEADHIANDERETDYVSRQWLLTEYDNRHKGPPGGARKMIEEAPPADVRPVVRGEWEWRNVDGRCVLACSKCGSIMPTDHALDYIDAEDNHFCYWCGADMRTIGQRLSDISVEEDLFPELTAEEKAANRAEAKRMKGGQ